MTATETKREKELWQDVANFDIEMELEESWDAEGHARPIRKKKPMSVPPITTVFYEMIYGFLSLQTRILKKVTKKIKRTNYLLL